MRNRKLWLLLPLVAMVATAPCLAEIFTVNLVNGQSFETRYKPEIAGWDDSKVLIVTEVGNRITLDRADIVGMAVDTQVRGYGLVIDTTTIMLGYAPNDNPFGEDAELDSSQQLLQFLQARENSQPDYSVEQFVSVEDAGLGGLPASGWGGYSGFGLGEPAVVAPRGPRNNPNPPRR